MKVKNNPKKQKSLLTTSLLCFTIYFCEIVFKESGSKIELIIESLVCIGCIGAITTYIIREIKGAILLTNDEIIIWGFQKKIISIPNIKNIKDFAGDIIITHDEGKTTIQKDRLDDEDVKNMLTYLDEKLGDDFTHITS